MLQMAPATNCYEENLIKHPGRSAAATILLLYYAATFLFVILDFAVGFNVRLSFLEPYPAARIAYYAVCLVCLALMLWRPAWTELIGAFESLVTLIALILSMGIRAIIVSDTMLEGTFNRVTFPEIINFLLAGGIAYIAWIRGISRLKGINRY